MTIAFYTAGWAAPVRPALAIFSRHGGLRKSGCRIVK
jgi:hypothetical protein